MSFREREEPFRKALDTLDPEFFERTFTCRLVRRDGSERVAYVVAHLETDAEDVAVRVHGTLQDVTERVFWEKRYEEQASLLERIFSNVHLMIAYMDPEFNFIRVNQAYAAADGRDPAFFVGRNHFDLYPNQENEGVFRGVVETGEAHQSFAKSFEYAYSPERGGTYWDWSLTPVKGRDGRVEGLILALSDVTDRVRVQETLQRDRRELEKAVKERTGALAESEEKFRVLFEQAAGPIFLVDPETGRLLDYNRRARELFGYTREELESLSVADLECVESPDEVKQHLGKIVAAGFDHFETKLKTKRGEVRDLLLHVTTIPFRGKRIISSIGIDITERKRVEKALQASELQLRAERDLFHQALESLDHPFYVIDVATYEIVMANTATGLVRQAERPLCYAVTHNRSCPCDGKDHPCPLEMVKRNKRPVTVRHVHYDPAGNERIVEVRAYPMLDEGRELIRVIESATDITERIRSEEALRDLTRAVEQSPASIVITDVLGNITYVNPRFTEITGYEPSESIGKNPRILKSELHPPELYKEMWDTLTAGKEWRGEVCNRKKNGELYWESALISPMKNDAGQTTHFLGIKEDITERKKADQLREDVERIMRHDLKAPINGLINLPGLVLSEGGLTPSQADLLEKIEEAGWRMLDSIDRSLDLFKMETGAYLLAPEPVDMVRVFGDVVLEQRAKAAERAVGMDLVVEGSGGGEEEFWVVGEESLCRSMLSALVANAVEASPPGGRVTVRLGGEGEWAVIAIHNEGVVPLKIRPVFFEKYATHGKKGGTGLGAYSARLMAEAQGGGIGFATSEEEGTTVTARLPQGRPLAE